jgi:hypothetical protein
MKYVARIGRLRLLKFRVLKNISALIILAAVISCSLIPLNYYRMYSGHPLDRHNVAILTHRHPYSQEVFILRIDGQARSQPVGIVELLPGNHDLLLGYVTSGAILPSSAGGSTMSFYHHPQQNALLDAKTGHTYIVYPEVKEGGAWRPVIQDITDQLSTAQGESVAKAIDKYWNLERQKTGVVGR